MTGIPVSWRSILSVPACIINLDRRPDRLALALHRTRTAGFTALERFPAADGRRREHLTAAWQRVGNPRISHEEYGFQNIEGAQACLLSHLELRERIITDDVPIATIVEDDIPFAKRWEELAPRFYAGTPKDFDLLYLGGNLHRPDRGYVVPAPTWGPW